MTKQSMLKLNKLNYLPENSRNELKVMKTSDKNFFFFDIK